jgi:hypothetical protein
MIRDEIQRIFGNLEGIGTLANILGTLMDCAEDRKTFREGVRDWSKVGSTHTTGDAINVIPFGESGKCREILLVISLGKSDFDRRLREAHDHCAIDCPGITKGVLFVTDYWDNERFWDSRAATFKKLSDKYGLTFALGIWSGKSIAVEQVIP